MRLVIIESPYKGHNYFNLESNIEYAKYCALHCLRLGESPFVSHLLYTEILNDKIPSDRNLGIEAGLAWGKKADASVVYIDRGISEGMKQGIKRAIEERRPVEFRMLYRKDQVDYEQLRESYPDVYDMLVSERKSNVFSRSDCVFNYCPNPESCVKK